MNVFVATKRWSGMSIKNSFGVGPEKCAQMSIIVGACFKLWLQHWVFALNLICCLPPEMQNLTSSNLVHIDLAIYQTTNLRTTALHANWSSNFQFSHYNHSRHRSWLTCAKLYLWLFLQPPFQSPKLTFQWYLDLCVSYTACGNIYWTPKRSQTSNLTALSVNHCWFRNFKIQFFEMLEHP